jgi:hypothetical protein
VRVIFCCRRKVFSLALKRFSLPQSLMFLWNTQSNEKALLRGSHYGAWDLLTLPRHSGRAFGPESRQLELGHAASLDSGQKHAGMTARGLYKSPSRDLFQSRVCRDRRDIKRFVLRIVYVRFFEFPLTFPPDFFSAFSASSAENLFCCGLWLRCFLCSGRL